MLRVLPLRRRFDYSFDLFDGKGASDASRHKFVINSDGIGS
jgi:hypothetical protein